MRSWSPTGSMTGGAGRTRGGSPAERESAGGGGIRYSAADIYDPATGAFTPQARMLFMHGVSDRHAAEQWPGADRGRERHRLRLRNCTIPCRVSSPRPVSADSAARLLITPRHC